MRPRWRAALPGAILAGLLAPAVAHADGAALAATTGATAQYVSAWDDFEPAGQFGLKFLTIDSDLDLGGGVSYSQSFDDDGQTAGSLGLDFDIRIHESIWGSAEDIYFLGMAGLSYQHLWAEESDQAAYSPSLTSWITRNVFRARIGVGFMVISDGFYMDMTLWGGGGLLWPEPDWIAGGGVDISLGVYLD